jgi:hypothetical protein
MKPRPDLARLKRLPAAKRKKIFEWLNGDPEKEIAPLSLAAAAAQIKKRWRIKVSQGQLSEFYSWYPLSEELREAKTIREEIGDYLSEHPNINLDSDTVAKVGQIIFEKRALRKHDPKLFVALRRLRQKDLDQAMDRDRFEVESVERFLKWYAMTKMRDLADSDLPHSAKIAAMRKVAFQDVDALEKSGSVRLPPP